MSAASPEGTLTVDRGRHQASTTAASQPSRFVAGVWLVLVATFSWAVAGLLVGMLGVFSLGTLLPVWAVLGAALWIASRPARAAARRPHAASTRWLRAGALAVAAATVVLNGALPGEHLQTGRDGGTYTATAGWLATDGGLRIDAMRPPFDAPVDRADGTPDLRYDAAGFHEIVEDGPLYAQFMHAFPAILATVEVLGGPGWMVRVNALLGGVALLAFYAFGERLVRPWAALVAQLGLAVNLVFIYFTRAPFSEPLTMVMLFAGLWALDQAVAGRDRRTALLAGLFIGGTFVARLDGLVILLMALVALLPPVVRGRLRAVAPAALVGVGISAAIALVDLFVFSPFYVQLHVSFLVPLALGFLAASAIGVGATLPQARAAVRWVMRRRASIALGLAVLIVVAGLFVYVVRPNFVVATWGRTTPIGLLQQSEGEPIDEARTYAEQSARWLGWYLGLPGLALALLGWAAMVRHTVARRAARYAPFVLILSGLTVLYIWMPSITPDHIWADRRYLPVVYPGLGLCAVWLLDRVVRPERALSWRTATATLGAVVLLVGPAWRSAPLLGLQEQAGMADDVAAACDRLGDDAALLLLDEDDTYMHYRMTQPLRAHCGVPAAWTSERITDERLTELARRAEDNGRTLWVLAAHADAFADRPVGDVTTLIAHRGVRLEQTLTVPPRDLTGYGLDVLGAPVTASSGASTG